MLSARFFQALALLAVVGFVFGLLGRLNWNFDLFSHFRMQYAVILLACGVALVTLRQWRSGAASLVAGLTLAVLAIFPFPRNPPSAAGARTLKLVSFNVNTANPGKQEVLRFLEKEDADLVFLMEVNNAWVASLKPLEARYPHRLAAPRSDNFGAAVYSKHPLSGGGIRYFGEYDLPWVALELPDLGMHIAAVHPLPPGETNTLDRNRMLLEVASQLKDKPGAMLCGDLNLTPYSPWFREVLARGGLRNPAPPYSPTWMRHSLFAIPIDHVLLGPGLTLVSRRIEPPLGSDHNAVVVEIAKE